MKDHLRAARELIEKLALEVVLVKPKDVEGAAVILNYLDGVSDLFKEAGKETFVDLAMGIKSIAERLASDEQAEPRQCMKQIEDGISLFQEILRDGEDIGASSKKIAKYLCECGLSGSATTRDPMEKASSDIAQDKELLEGFTMEALEHLGTIEVNVLTLEQNPQDLDVMNTILRLFHTIKGISGFLNLTHINLLAHEVETLLDDAINQKLIVDEAVTDVILDAVDLMTAMINHLRQELDTGKIQDADFQLDDFLSRLKTLQVGKAEMEPTEETEAFPIGDGADTGDILVEKGAVSTQDVAEALEKQGQTDKKIGEILMEDDKVRARDVAEALREQKKSRGGHTWEQQRPASTAFAKVDTHKLDNMVDMVGELVITQAMLGRDISNLVGQDTQLYGNFTQLGRITSEIQKVSMSMRMVAMKETFQKMLRLVRDLSKKSGKLVTLQMIGEDTEIDRNMVEEIYDPLVHTVRNCIDHGIETPDVRKALGKPGTATVTLKAYHKGGGIVIDISDNGKGLDSNKIFKKAVQRGLISADDSLSDQQIFNLICRPGFSTAEKVTEVSGRGVGMDVVKRAVDRMRGKLEMHSVKDEGTTVRMKLPLTTAVIDGIIVRAGNRDFIIPTASVIESIKPDRSAYTNVANRGELMKIRDSLHPLVRLHSLFDFEPLQRDPWEAIVVVAESDGQRKCLLVDDLIGKQEVVIKSLGQGLKKVKGVAGAAILADGRVGLILDVAGVFGLSENAPEDLQKVST